MRLEAGGNVGVGHGDLALLVTSIERDGDDGCINYKVSNGICAGV
ncbi:hypothetical protein [Bradyrhizobium symbiodeficiens]|uniref:Uncharacterized protein n=1 Tax=Bradyrhizobium symbiodeficiens TaxID=1404367 RepID=A0AAJ6MLD2_9BRAD|nr:hypothetical protein [Bradyrhizobium symbiodeficiens]